MPYIECRRRRRIAALDPATEDAITYHEEVTTPGELNFAITDLCNSYLREKSYANFNEIIGVLECVKLEFYRRMVAPYEDKKCKENGDVYN